MSSTGAEGPQRGGWHALVGDIDLLAAAGLGTWCWNSATDAFFADRCCLHHIDALANPPHSLEVLIGLVHPGDRQLLRGTLREAASRGTATTVSFRIVAGDLSVRWLQGLVSRRIAPPSEAGAAVLVGVIGPHASGPAGTPAEARPDLQHVLQAAPVACAKFDRGLNLIHANERFLETLRLQDFDWNGRTLYDALPELPAGWREAVDRCLAGDGTQDAAEGFERSDGSQDRVAGQIYPWYDDSDRIGGVLLITEVRANGLDKRFTVVVDQAPVGIAVANRTGKVRYANGAWIGLVGRDRDQVIGEDALLYLHPDDRAEATLQSGNLVARGHGERSMRVLLPSGDIRWIDLLGRPMSDGTGEQATVYTALDVTGRTRQQHESGRMLTQLRDLVLHLEDLRGHERSRTVQTLQYGLYESLYGLHAELSRWARDPDAADAAADPAGELARRSHAAVEQLRHVLYELTPPGVAELGLAGALERACGEQRDRTGLPIELVVPDEPVSACDAALDALYQAGRAAIIDATGHGGVSRIAVQLEQLSGMIRLRIEDNGFGKSRDDATQRGRESGLLAASLRVRAQGGTMRVLGIAGVATTVEVSIPVGN